MFFTEPDPQLAMAHCGSTCFKGETMLVIRPNHKSGKLNLAVAIKKWADTSLSEEEAKAVKEVEEYKDVFVVVKQVSREVFVESMSKARSAATGDDSETELFAAMSDLVRLGIEEVIGLSDANGPVVVKAEAGSLTDDVMELLGINDLTIDLWRVVKCYNELDASEKKLFGEQVQLTSVA